MGLSQQATRLTSSLYHFWSKRNHDDLDATTVATVVFFIVVNSSKNLEGAVDSGNSVSAEVSACQKVCRKWFQGQTTHHLLSPSWCVEGFAGEEIQSALSLFSPFVVSRAERTHQCG
ncbi:hypothetical protein R6Q59_035772 [Mikania micrantha]